MLIQLNRPDIIENIRSRFDARETGKRLPLELDDTIKLVLDVDELTKSVILQYETAAIGATGLNPTLTVPDGERWKVSAVSAKLLTGTYLFSRIFIGDGTNIITVFAGSAAAELYSSTLGHPFWLDSGWTISGYVSSYTNPGNAELKVLTEVFETY